MILAIILKRRIKADVRTTAAVVTMCSFVDLRSLTAPS